MHKRIYAFGLFISLMFLIISCGSSSNTPGKDFMKKTMFYKTDLFPLKDLKALISEQQNIQSDKLEQFMKEFTVEQFLENLKAFASQEKLEFAGWEKVDAGWKLNLKDNQRQREGFLVFEITEAFDLTGKTDYGAAHIIQFKLGNEDLTEKAPAIYIECLMEYIKKNKSS